MNDHPIVAGSALFTLVDPTEGHEVAYNRWYERDHFYAGCLIGPWLFAGKRWVATRALKDLRFPVDGDAVASPVDLTPLVSPETEPLIDTPKTALVTRYPIEGSDTSLLCVNVHALNIVSAETLQLQLDQGDILSIDAGLSPGTVGEGTLTDGRAQMSP